MMAGGPSPAQPKMVQANNPYQQEKNQQKMMVSNSNDSFRNVMLGWKNYICQQRLLKCSQLLSRNICSGARGAFFLWAVQTADSIMNEKPFHCLL